ncbi:hypothetical protein PENTCL1PPCAC_18789, partial [Pristionchus entomophagus]
DLVMVGSTIHEFRLVTFPLTNGIFENYDCQFCLRTRVTLSFICPMTQDLLNCFIALNRLTSSALIIVLYAMAALSLRKLVGSSKMKKKEQMLLKIGILTFVIAIPGMILQVRFSY